MSANPPSDPDASPKSEPGEDGDDPGESDDEDTEPLQTLNPYGAGWGAGWGASWGRVGPGRIRWSAPAARNRCNRASVR